MNSSYFNTGTGIVIYIHMCKVLFAQGHMQKLFFTVFPPSRILFSTDSLPLVSKKCPFHIVNHDSVELPKITVNENMVD